MATIVFVHAHPDDEAILTAGTMKALSLAGHRVLLVLATDGGAGLTSSSKSQGLGDRRLQEADTSARALGVAERIWLGFGDSGLDGRATTQTDHSVTPLCHADLEHSAQKLAEILKSQEAGVVVGYDRRGGYGHPDHVRVHELVHRATEIAETPCVFEATLDREVISALIGPILLLGRLFRIGALNNLRHGFSARHEITHCVNVRSLLDAKRASMRAHASQTVGGGLPRSLQVFLSLPNSIFARVLGTEFFIQTRGHHVDNALAKLAETSVKF